MTSSELSIERLFLILRARIWLILGILAAAIATASVITYLTPNMYTATNSLNFDFNIANPIDSRGNTLSLDNYVSTQMDIMRSLNVAQKVEGRLTEYERERFIASVNAERTVMDEVVGSVKRAIKSIKSISVSDKNTRVDQRGTNSGESINVNSAYTWFAQMVGRNLSVEPRIASRIVDISYSSTDPRIAAFMANRFSEAYIATNIEMTVDPARQASHWFDEQIKDLRGKLEDEQAALTAYQQQQEIVSTDETLDTENSRLRELSSQLISAQQETRNAVFAQKKLKEIQGKGVPLTSFSVVFDNPVVSNIKQGIRKLQGDLVDISASLGKNHPRYKRVSSELAAAHGRLQAEIKVITDGINNNAELAREREMDLSAALNEQKRLVLDLKQQHNKITVLERGVESANTTYNAALAQQNTSNMQSLLDQSSVFVVDPANIPSGPSSPKLTKNLALGVLGGIVLAIGLVVLMEIFSRRVRSKEDLLLELKVPLLGYLK